MQFDWWALSLKDRGTQLFKLGKFKKVIPSKPSDIVRRDFFFKPNGRKNDFLFFFRFLSPDRIINWTKVKDILVVLLNRLNIKEE